MDESPDDINPHVSPADYGAQFLWARQQLIPTPGIED